MIGPKKLIEVDGNVTGDGSHGGDHHGHQVNLAGLYLKSGTFSSSVQKSVEEVFHSAMVRAVGTRCPPFIQLLGLAG